MINFTFSSLHLKHFPIFLLITSCRWSTQTITFLTGDGCGRVGVGVVMAAGGVRTDEVETADDFGRLMPRMGSFVVGGCGVGVRGDSLLLVLLLF